VGGESPPGAQALPGIAQAGGTTLADMSEAPRRSRSRAVGLVIGAILILALAVGALLFVQNRWPIGQNERPTPQQPTPGPEEPEEPAEFYPDGTADENLPYFRQTLDRFAAGDEPIEGRPVVDAVAGAGFDRAAMQVSFDRTQTDLVADNIFVSVRIGEDCLIGQILTADRTPYAVVEPAVGPEQNICLIGNTRPIDW
jgi:hypothetical protein